LDHHFYSIPKEPVNWAGYKFPSSCIGVDGIYQAYRYLYQNSSNYKSFANSENTILLSKLKNSEIMEEIVYEVGESYR